MGRKPVHIEPGTMFGRWSVQRKETTEASATYFRCLCTCGHSKLVLGTSLLRGDSKGCKSCSVRIRQFGNNNTGWTGHAGISGRYWCSIKNGAKKRGIEFDLTIEDAWRQFIDQGGICTYTGRQLRFGTREEQTASLDRVSSSEGYRLDNIEWVYKPINRAKGTMSSAEFTQLCVDVAKHRKGE